MHAFFLGLRLVLCGRADAVRSCVCIKLLMSSQLAHSSSRFSEPSIGQRRAAARRLCSSLASIESDHANDEGQHEDGHTTNDDWALELLCVGHVICAIMRHELAHLRGSRRPGRAHQQQAAPMFVAKNSSGSLSRLRPLGSVSGLPPNWQTGEAGTRSGAAATTGRSGAGCSCRACTLATKSTMNCHARTRVRLIRALAGRHAWMVAVFAAPRRP